jgi:hypothetical protein
MKWTETLDKDLEQLVLSGKKYAEIAELLNTTRKSIQNRCFRLKIQVVTHKDINCKQCQSVVKDIVSSKREFCSNSCANTYSNLHRTHSQETKDKISKAINKTNIKIGRVKQVKIKLNRKCKFCQEFKVDKNRKTICEDCRYDYYKAYRPSCEFRFTLADYPGEFDFNLIKEHGWYSPSNKENNLKGISRDHLYSVKDGFINKVDPIIISHPANCKLVIHTDNQKKNVRSEITLEELQNRIKIWNLKYV